MSWQDWVISGSQVGFLLALVPTIRNTNVVVPRRTSVPTAAFTAANAVAFGTMGMWLTVTTSVLGAVGWGAIAVYRSRVTVSER